MGRKAFLTDETKWLSSLYSNKKYKLNKKDGFNNITKEEFIDWFDEKEYNKGCYYCGTTHETSKKLFDFQTITKGRIDGTRGQKRMHRLELERKNPIESYDNLKNLAWACHWCNNAKSNFFTEAEFHPTISLAIKNVIDKISKEIDDLTNK
jgi:hypothetical protein